MPMILKKCYLILCIKRLQILYKNITGLKKVILQTKNNKDLKEKVLDKAADLFNELYYTYK